ncbi:hypothetical protein QOZ80_9BG0706470 [Eleusine coracana subsp. coracana]|nr:hypothetical protein QOZ80_9BG0706470 [Eleusine coracana subsp. coracana]
MSSVRFDDDEKPITATSNEEKQSGGFTDVGKASVKAEYLQAAPLEKGTVVQVLLDVSASSTTVGRAALDLVVVLDVSGSMGDDGKLDRLKNAMKFVIQKLSPMDRLSIVTFNNTATKQSGLLAMSDTGKDTQARTINNLVHGGGTNIKAGLETGLKIIASRQFSVGRTGNIIVMSDGQQNDGDAREVTVPSSVPVYTLSFGKGTDHDLMRAITKNNGTFNAIPDNGDVTAVFSQLLAGLLTVVVRGLHLILSKPRTIDNELDSIIKVEPGDYKVEPKDGPYSTTVTVILDELFSAEVRKVIVDLSLAEGQVPDEYLADILEIGVSYPDSNDVRQPFRGQVLQVTRRDGAPTSPLPRPLQLELARRQHADSISKARSLADADNLDGAREKLMEAQNALEDIVDQANPMVGMLKKELGHLMDFMESKELYQAEGRPYALASESSHASQRFTARGDVEGVRLFATPRMDTYLEQAKEYTKDPTKPLPTAAEDTKQEVKANPTAAIAAPIAFYIQSAIQALQAIEKIITATAKA